MREIYLIDKSDIDRFVTQKLLELWLTDVCVISKLTTKDILRRAKSGTLTDPIIMIDIDIPPISGIEFTNRMAAFNPKLSIYVLSHFLNADHARKFCNCPLIKDYIAKPIDRIDVVRIASENKLSLSKMIES